MTGGYMRYTDMFEQYKGYGEAIKGLRDALEPIKGLGDVLESVKGLGDVLEPIKGLRDTWAPITGYQSMIESAMSAWTSASNMGQLVNDQVTFLSQNYSGMETLLSQADRMLGFYGSDIAEGMKSAMSGYAGMAEQLNYNSVYQNIAGLLDSYGSIKDVVDSIYSSLPLEDYGDENEEYATYEYDNEENIVRESAENKDSELEIDFADEQELQEALEEENTAQDKFFKRIKNWAEEKKKKYKIYKFIMFVLVNVFLLPYLQENVGKPVMTKVVSCVKQAPEKGAEIICRLKDGIQAIITENTNYYYKVKFTDENGVEREGYVAKKNLRVIEEEEGETEQENDEMEQNKDEWNSEGF